MEGSQCYQPCEYIVSADGGTETNKQVYCKYSIKLLPDNVFKK